MKKGYLMIISVTLVVALGMLLFLGGNNVLTGSIIFDPDMCAVFDVNDDNLINCEDLDAFAECYGSCDYECEPPDYRTGDECCYFNVEPFPGTGCINAGDLSYLAPAYGVMCTCEGDDYADCRPECGNGIIEPVEECDDGEDNGVVCEITYGDEECTYCNEVAYCEYSGSPLTTCEEITVPGMYCGDGSIQGDYESCESDSDCLVGEICTECSCVSQASECGDGTCDDDETCLTCEEDCGECESECGDLTCDDDETCLTCEEDCGECESECGDGTCDTGDGETCTSCEADCGECESECDDGTCDSDEDCSSCPSDCGACPPTCGDGTCDSGETCSSCEVDCGACPPCDLTSAAWSTEGPVIDGFQVTLIVQGTNCNGQGVSFEVFESDDLTSDDPASINPPSAIFVGDTAISTWTAEWQCDGYIPLLGCTGGNSEWYFIVDLLQDSDPVLSDFLLEVSEADPTCGNGVVQDGEECDDGNEENGDGCSSTCEYEANWPAESWGARTILTPIEGSSPNDFYNDLSGAVWNPVTDRLWVVRNGPGGSNSKIWVAEECRDLCTDEYAFDGFQIDYKDGNRGEWTGFGDLEGITQADFNEEVVYLIIEGEERIKEYGVSTYGVSTLNNNWDTRSYLPKSGGSGAEGITFVPDEFLEAQGFVDSNGDLYVSQNGMGGLMFVGHQNGGRIYVFDLNRNDATFDFVGAYKTSHWETAGLEFDRSTGKLYIFHGANHNRVEVVSLSSTIVGSERKFDQIDYYSYIDGGNMEGIALMSLDDCENGKRKFFLTVDDGGYDGFNLFKQFTCDPAL